MTFECGAGDGQVGDILPTFVTPDDAKRYIGETDAQWTRLAQDVSAGATDASFRQSFAADLSAWQAFRDDAIANVGWLNTKATMEQTDRWVAKLSGWRSSLVAAGGKVTGPAPSGPGQGVPDPSPSMLPKVLPWVIGIGVLVAAGYAVRSVATFVALIPRRKAAAT